jgi:succinate dehydrogenase hydrophobic anchor subunit
MILKEWIAEREFGDYKLSPIDEEILNSFDMITEGTFWGATKKFVDKMWQKMVIFGGVAFGPTAMNKVKDEVKSWEKEKGLVQAKNFKDMKERVIKVLQGAKSDIKKDHEGTGMLNESDISKIDLSECMITIDDARQLFTITENHKGLDLLDELCESKSDDKLYQQAGVVANVLSTFGFLGGWLAGAKIATLMGWASSFWSAVFVKGIIAQAVIHGGVGNAIKTTGTMVAGGMAGVVSLGVVVALLATLIVAGAKILEKIKKVKGK